MMISTKLSLQSLALVLVVFTVFTVSLTENLQIADGLASESKRMVFEMQVGETQMDTWLILNNEPDPITVEFYATGEGSELLVFEKYLELESDTNKTIELFVVVPEDHPDDIEYHVDFFALKRSEGFDDPSINGILVNVQMVTRPVIKIGDNPIFTQPLVEEVKDDEPLLPPPTKQTPKVTEVEETMEEKLARINAANEANTPVMGETPAQATGQFEVEDPVSDYVPEPVTEINPVGTFSEEEEGGGCLIATATFGSELAPQVQLLREIRDNQLMGTGSGIAFMSGFNSLYYSFSPTIADMERESPIFKELVKLTITPMISTLSVMEYAETDSEVLGLGIGVILMNLGMYVGLPTFGILKLIQTRKN